ncbi:hypothetical protein QUA56_16130 [Microcoleus sp. N3A4]
MGSSNSNVQRYIYTAREINSRVYEVDGAIALLTYFSSTRTVLFLATTPA